MWVSRSIAQVNRSSTSWNHQGGNCKYCNASSFHKALCRLPYGSLSFKRVISPFCGEGNLIKLAPPWNDCEKSKRRILELQTYGGIEIQAMAMIPKAGDLFRKTQLALPYKFDRRSLSISPKHYSPFVCNRYLKFGMQVILIVYSCVTLELCFLGSW